MKFEHSMRFSTERVEGEFVSLPLVYEGNVLQPLLTFPECSIFKLLQDFFSLCLSGIYLF